MKNNYESIVILYLFVSIICLTVSCSERDYEGRNFKGVDKLEDLSKRVSSHLLQPMTLLVENKKIYILDYGSHKIKVFNMKGKLEREIGDGRGEGPGQVIHAGEFDVGKESVWMVDLRGRKVVRFDDDGEYIDQFRVDHPVNKIEILDDVVVVRNPAGKKLFVQYDKKGNRIKRFGIIDKEGANNPMSVTGHMVEINDREFAYLTHYASYVFNYKDLSLHDELLLVDNQEFLSGESRNEGEGARYMAPKTNIQYLEISYSDNQIYTLTKIKDKKLTIIDAYNYDKSSYIESYKVDDRVNKAVVQGDTIFSVTGSGFRAYEINQRGLF